MEEEEAEERTSKREKKVEKSEKASGHSAKVFLLSLTSPILEPISSSTPIITVIKFLENFSLYHNRGGNINLVNCLVLSRAEEVAIENGKQLEPCQRVKQWSF